MLAADLHRATRSFRPPADAVWFPWHGRELGGSPVKVIGHCDVAPWNIVAWDGLPVALIDWETAGPVDPLPHGSG
jgi:thiamine kinase-like enzyme